MGEVNLRVSRLPYERFEDPGHSWLRVERSELRSLKIENLITGCSYQGSTATDTGFVDVVYLEEDYDEVIFLQAKIREGCDDVNSIMNCKSTYQEQSQVRSLRHYEKPFKFWQEGYLTYILSEAQIKEFIRKKDGKLIDVTYVPGTEPFLLSKGFLNKDTIIVTLSKTIVYIGLDTDGELKPYRVRTAMTHIAPEKNIKNHQSLKSNYYFKSIKTGDNNEEK